MKMFERTFVTRTSPVEGWLERPGDCAGVEGVEGRWAATPADAASRTAMRKVLAFTA